ncbi:MAG TPA: preprotein translocase subunit SecE [Haloplasmataceae bacterium]
MENKNKVYGIIKYVSGIIGFLGVLLTILTLTGVVDWYLFTINYHKSLTSDDKIVLSMISLIIGAIFLSIAFSNQIDRFYNYLESHTIKSKKDKEKKGISLEAIFYILISLVAIVLADLLAANVLNIKADLPLLGGATKTVFIVALIVLGVFSLVTAFRSILFQSIKEMKKVQWPTGREMIKYSKQVFSFIIFFSILFLLLDLLFTYLPISIENLFGL